MRAGGASFWAELHLLDHQVLDREGQATAKVDDLQFDLLPEPDSLPVVTHILCGPAALARRFSGRLGRAVETLHRLMDEEHPPRPASISFGVVTGIDAAVHVDVSVDDLEVKAADAFLAAHFIGHIPGSSHRRAQGAGQRVIRASDLVGKPAFDEAGRRLGTVHDLHLVQDGPLLPSGRAALRLHGLLAGRSAVGARLGYSTREGRSSSTETRGPWPLRYLFRRLHRRAHYIPWGDVVAIEYDKITVSTGVEG